MSDKKQHTQQIQPSVSAQCSVDRMYIQGSIQYGVHEDHLDPDGVLQKTKEVAQIDEKGNVYCHKTNKTFNLKDIGVTIPPPIREQIKCRDLDSHPSYNFLPPPTVDGIYDKCREHMM